MKNILILSAIFAVSTLSSCTTCYDCQTEECVTITSGGTTASICEGDYNTIAGITWSDYKAAVVASGGSVTASTTSEICDDDDKASAVANGSTCTEK
jgi:hypothetical protein